MLAKVVGVLLLAIGAVCVLQGVLHPPEFDESVGDNIAIFFAVITIVPAIFLLRRKKRET
jgi:hypothetical protein